MEMTRLEIGCDPVKEEFMQGWFNKAEAALSANRPADAVSCFDMVLKDDPFNARAYSGLSRAYWEQGRTEDALNSLTRALELEPNDREIILQCSRVFGALGRKDFAEEVLESYLERNPEDAGIRSELESSAAARAPASRSDASGVAAIFREQGLVEFERGRVDRAIFCFETAIEKDPDFAEAHSDLGVIHQQGGNIEKALEHFYKALDLKPEDPEILGNSARALSLAGETEAAADLLRLYLRRCPEDEPAWGEYEDLVRLAAVPQWNSTASSPEVAAIYVETAQKLMGAGDLPGAGEAVEKALKIRPDAVDALLVLGLLHKEIGQTREAVDVLNRALEVDPSSRECSKLLKSIRKGEGGGGV